MDMIDSDSFNKENSFYCYCVLLPRWFGYILTPALHFQVIKRTLVHVAQDSLMGSELLQLCLCASCSVFDPMCWRCWHRSPYHPLCVPHTARALTPAMAIY